MKKRSNNQKQGRLRLKRAFSKDILIRSLLAIGIFAALAAVVYTGKGPHRISLNEGDISTSSIYAPYAFTYKGEVDQERTEAARKEAASKVKDVYKVEASLFEEAARGIDGLLAPQELGEEDKAKISKGVRNILESIMNRGIISSSALKELEKSGKKAITVVAPEGEFDIAIDGLVDIEKARRDAADMARKIFEGSKSGESAAIDAAQKLLKANLVYDNEETARRIESAVKGTPLVYRLVNVKKDELIVSKGERITGEHLAQFKELTKRQSQPSQRFVFLGLAILTLIFMAIGGVYLKRYETKAYANTGNLFLISIILIFISALAKAITLSPWPSYIIPVAGASMLLAILLNPRLALMVSLLFSVYLGFITGEKLGIIVFFLASGIVGIYSVRGIRRRSALLKAALLVGAANVAVICGMGLMNGLAARTIFTESLWGIGNGIASAAILMVTLPLFEYLFNITTDISLLELSDLNHPLLKKMIMEAPGTYHHSLIVGNLAESACEAIGANSLLARVGAYFHDIGKIDKAEYFTENQNGKAAGHDKLTPTMSSLIIINHVKSGLELAKKYKLKASIMDFIKQHHGNNLIYYFYQKALEQIKDDAEIKEGDYRYPGPRPQTKETAIVLLADAVEAASRTLSDPTPARIEGLVQKMINNKFIDSQLDECDLTLKDLHKIAESFTKVLTGMFHTRVEYPSRDEGEGAKVVNENDKGAESSRKRQDRREGDKKGG